MADDSDLEYYRLCFAAGRALLDILRGPEAMARRGLVLLLFFIIGLKLPGPVIIIAVIEVTVGPRIGAARATERRKHHRLPPPREARCSTVFLDVST